MASTGRVLTPDHHRASLNLQIDGVYNALNGLLEQAVQWEGLESLHSQILTPSTSLEHTSTTGNGDSGLMLGDRIGDTADSAETLDLAEIAANLTPEERDRRRANVQKLLDLLRQQRDVVTQCVADSKALFSTSSATKAKSPLSSPAPLSLVSDGKQRQNGGGSGTVYLARTSEEDDIQTLFQQWTDLVQFCEKHLTALASKSVST